MVECACGRCQGREDVTEDMLRTIYPHHQATIDRVADEFGQMDEILALVVGGSVAHGFASETADVDVMFIVSNEEYQERLDRRALTYVNWDLATYEGGYVDGKFITTDFLRLVAEKGSEPARFAFKDAFVAFSRIDGLDALLQAASRYPVEGKADRIKRFYAQFEAWKWYIREAKKHDNLYLLTTAVANFTLFAGRLILAYNEELYPYHKWFMRVLEQVAHKPEGLGDQIELVLTHREDSDIDRLYGMITEFSDWGCEPHRWSMQFMLDSELNWIDGTTPVADL
jgi:predicted nucleotidyltransferase